MANMDRAIELLTRKGATFTEFEIAELKRRAESYIASGSKSADQSAVADVLEDIALERKSIEAQLLQKEAEQTTVTGQ